MSQRLFRTEALAHASAGVEGGLVVRQPTITRVFAIPILLGFMCALWFLAHMDYAHKVTVSGYLSFKKGLLPLLSPESAVIARVLVVEGQWVEQHTPLVELSKTQTLVDQSDKNKRHRKNLLAEIDLSEKQTQADIEVLKTSIAKSELRAQNLKNLLRGESRQLQLHARKQTLAKRQLQRAKRLAVNGVFSLAEVQRIEANHLLEANQVVNAKITLGRLTGEQAEQKLVTRELTTKLSSVIFQAQAAALRQQSRLLELEAQNILLVAPKAGRVSGLSALVGARVNSGQPLMALLDEGAELEAILFVPPRGSGQLVVGQSVRLRYAGFPYQKYGSQNGEVTEVGRSLVLKGTPEDPVVVREPAYKIRVKPDKRTVTAFGKQVALTSGMLLEADLVSDVRPLWMWWLNPLLSLRGEH